MLYPFQLTKINFVLIPMVRLLHKRFIGIAGLFLTACNQLGFAQNVNFTAQASAAKMGLQDQIQLTYTIQNAQDLKALAPAGDNFKDFDIVGGPFQSQSTQVYVSNGHMVQSQSISLTYILHPRHTGNLTIPQGVAKDAAGHTYQSNAVPVQVVTGSLANAQPRGRQNPFDDDPFDDPFAALQQRRMQQMQQQRQQQQQKPVNMEDVNKDLFIKVIVDKDKVHVGEQITASYKLYARIPMQMGISKLPSLNGFWAQDFEMPKGKVKPEEEIVNGKKYQVFLLKKSALFPQQTGTLELDPAEAQGVARVIQQVQQRNPFSDMFDDPALQRAMGSMMMNDPFFNNSFFNSMAYRDVQVHIKSTPVKIQVTALPDKGKPDEFGGAVGQFNIASKIDKTELTTDDVANLTLTITGSGNLKLIEAPKLKLPNGLETFDPGILDTITGRSTTISGSKIITYAITPHTPGDYQIPAIPFSYFDPHSGNYVSLSTQPVTIHVKPGKHYNPNMSASDNNLALKDIHNIQAAPIKNLSVNRKPVLFTPAYWSMYGIPLFAFIGLLFWKRREEELSKDTIFLRSKRANKVALKRLVTAQKLLQQNSEKPFYEEVSKAIWLYLSDKLSIPLSSLSRESASDVLASRKVPGELQARLNIVVTECETALYAPSGGVKQMHDTYKEAVKIISELEETV